VCLQAGPIRAQQPIDFDPFETADASLTAQSYESEQYDPFVTLVSSDSETSLLHVERAGEYDPFEAPVATTGEPPALAEFQERDYGPTLDEALPPPNATTDDPANYDPQAQQDVNCQWTPRPLGELTTNIHLPEGRLPRDCSAERPPHGFACCDPCGPTRGWPMIGYQWKASAFCHKPLYFEEINLERYGYGCCGCLQYGVSAAHFFGTVPALPYLMAADCPCECDYTLGHYRPGSCPPWQFHWPPCCDPLGTGSELGVVAGLIFLIP
jgi:hypothetical protein